MRVPLFYFPATSLVSRCTKSRNSGALFYVKLESSTIDGTTTGILTLRISFRVALVWRSSDACWDIPQRRQPSAMPTLPRIHCVRRRISLPRKSPASNEIERPKPASLRHEMQDRRFEPGQRPDGSQSVHLRARQRGLDRHEA